MLEATIVGLYAKRYRAEHCAAQEEQEQSELGCWVKKEELVGPTKKEYYEEDKNVIESPALLVVSLPSETASK